MDRDYVLYSINVEDAQTVALESIDRELSDDEIRKVEHRLGEYFPDWFEALEMAINNVVRNKVRSKFFTR